MYAGLSATVIFVLTGLVMSIPDSMFDQLDHYREVIYEHIYTYYKEAAA